MDFDVAFLSTWPIAFHGGSLTERPLGGSETALVEVARRVALRGRRVAVFCPVPEGAERTYDGVVYRHHAAAEAALADGTLAVGTLVVCRDPTRAWLGRFAQRTLLWLQDMPMEGLRRQHREALPFVDRFLAVSRFQRDRFVARFDLPPERFVVTRNGVDAARYRPWGERVRGRLVYGSTPFRGLSVLLDAFPRIRSAVPEATLHVFSGMSLYDQADAPFRALYDRASATAGVVRYDPVPQPALIDELRRADLMAYPATFDETSCVAAMMAISAGTPVVASSRAGLPETVGDCGVLVPGDAKRDADFPSRFADAVVSLLRDGRALDALRARCGARDLDWDPVVDAWWPLLVG